MKPVLFIGVGAPWRGGAGYLLRQQMFLQALAELAPLHLAMFDLDPLAERPDAAAALVALRRPPNRPVSKWQGLWRDLASPLPRLHRGGAGAAAVAQLHTRPWSDYSGVFAYRFDFARLAGLIGPHGQVAELGVPVLLDIDDPEHLRQADMLRSAGGAPPDWRTARDLRKLRRYERHVAAQVGAAFTCSTTDAAAFAPTPVQVVPNCVAVPAALPPVVRLAPTLLFVGNMRAGAGSPNHDAALWFVDQVWPLVRTALPVCEVVFAGPLSDALRSRLTRPGVQLLGFVDDLGTVYAGRPVCIAPILYGTGTRLKILEAMAHACAVVSTTKGCEGIDVTPGADIAVADAPAAFARACIELLADPARRLQIADAGHRLVDARYSAAGQQRRLVTMLRQALQPAGPNAG